MSHISSQHFFSLRLPPLRLLLIDPQSHSHYAYLLLSFFRIPHTHSLFVSRASHHYGEVFVDIGYRIAFLLCSFSLFSYAELRANGKIPRSSGYENTACVCFVHHKSFVLWQPNVLVFENWIACFEICHSMQYSKMIFLIFLVVWPTHFSFYSIFWFLLFVFFAFFCFLVLYVLSFGTCFFGSNLLFFCNARFFVNFSSFFLCFDTSATSVFFPETLARRSGYRKIPSQSASLQFYCLPFSVSSYMFFHLLLVRWICHQLLVAILNRKFQGVNIELPLAGNYHRLAEVNCLELHAYILFFILFFLEIFAYGWQFHRKCLTHLSAILLSWE